MSTLLETSPQTPVQPGGADLESELVPLEVAFETRGLGVSYSGTPAVADVDLEIPRSAITAFIGPSGCGKTTVLRCLNRMNDLVVGARVTGQVHYRGVDLHGHSIDPVAVRRRIGMVFQKPNPFPMSIRDNVAFGRKLAGRVARRELDDVVERSLGQAGLWSEVKDRLGENAMALSGGQQQRMCIARALAVDPEVVLMDEPCSALDPIATEHIEELLTGLVEDFTIVIVTHNMHQAARIADITAFFTTEEDAEGDRVGRLVEVGSTGSVFHSPQDQRTADYVGGRFG